MNGKKQKVVFVCGLSGAGRNTALKVLEDCGYHPIDNLPPKLLPRLFSEPTGQDKLALGFTILKPEEIQLLIGIISALRNSMNVELLFLEADEPVLVRRFSETRRIHPLTDGRPLQEGIADELKLLEPLKDAATLRINTSSLSPHDLKAQIKQRLNLEADHPFQVSVMSFSYKRGVPASADFVFDCRFLKNPHWDEALRANDGRDRAVVDYIETDPIYDDFRADIDKMLGYIVPRIQNEGRSYMTIAFGCSGGKHRSVAFAEKTYKNLSQAGFLTSLQHRELEQ
jgi:UPF0042 nucleotide-binding protein